MAVQVRVRPVARRDPHPGSDVPSVPRILRNDRPVPVGPMARPIGAACDGSGYQTASAPRLRMPTHHLNLRSRLTAHHVMGLPGDSASDLNPPARSGAVMATEPLPPAGSPARLEAEIRVVMWQRSLISPDGFDPAMTRRERETARADLLAEIEALWVLHDEAVLFAGLEET